MTEERSAEAVYWEESLRVEDLSDEDLEARRRELACIAEKAEAALYLLLDAAVAAGRMSPEDAANERAAFQARMKDQERRLDMVRERAKTMIKGPKEPN